MLSTRESFTAKVALDGQPRDAFKNVSRKLLAEGHDGPAIRQLAALEGAGSWTDGPVLDAALAEIGALRISKRRAALQLAQDLAIRMLSNGELAFPSFPSMLYRLWIASNYIDELAFVDNFEPSWSVHFESEAAASTALKQALEEVAALNLRIGEPAPHFPKPQSFRALIAPVGEEAVTPAPAIVPPENGKLTFRERWQAAREKDKGLLSWVATWGTVWIAYLYCEVRHRATLQRFNGVILPMLWLSIAYFKWFRDAKNLAALRKTWTERRDLRGTLQSFWRSALRWWRGVTLQ